MGVDMEPDDAGANRRHERCGADRSSLVGVYDRAGVFAFDIGPVPTLAGLAALDLAPAPPPLNEEARRSASPHDARATHIRFLEVGTT